VQRANHARHKIPVLHKERPVMPLARDALRAPDGGEMQTRRGHRDAWHERLVATRQLPPHTAHEDSMAGSPCRTWRGVCRLEPTTGKRMRLPCNHTNDNDGDTRNNNNYSDNRNTTTTTATATTTRTHTRTPTPITATTHGHHRVQLTQSLCRPRQPRPRSTWRRPEAAQHQREQVRWSQNNPRPWHQNVKHYRDDQQ
jgi:hypothetical protein